MSSNTEFDAVLAQYQEIINEHDLVLDETAVFQSNHLNARQKFVLLSMLLLEQRLVRELTDLPPVNGQVAQGRYPFNSTSIEEIQDMVELDEED